jgi:hypothetical protein
MKSERRHELQHNELAVWLIKSGESLQEHQNAIISAIVIVIAAFAGTWWWSYTSASQATEAWGNVTTALETGNVDLLTNVVDKYPNTRAAQMSALITADISLTQGCQLRFTDRANANEELKKAAKAYADSLAHGDSSTMQERGVYGQARSHEASGDLSAALEGYASVAKRWPNGAYAAAARQQIAFLEMPETKKMFDSLRSFDPKHVYSPEVGAPGKRPNTLPEESTSLESVTSGTSDAKKSPTETAKPAESKSQKPATSEKKK